MKKIINKRGDGYVFPCVIIVVVAMILSVVIFFANTVSLVRMTEENSKIVLDSYIMKNSIIIYDSIKQGNDYTEVIDEDVYIEDLCKFCTLDKNGSLLYNYNQDGSLKYMMTAPIVSFRNENTLKIQLNYTIYIPVQFDGEILWYARIPVTVISSFNEKF